MSSAALYGHVDKFDVHGKESFPNYLERLEFYFMANDIEQDNKKKSIFLIPVGPETFKLIKDLCTPEKPGDKTFHGICELIKEHLNPEPNVIVERLRFYTRTRRENESVAEYVAELRHLSTHCNLSAVLNDNLRDRIVCGVNNHDIQKKLLSVGNALTLDKALKLAISFETAAKNAESLPSIHTPEKPIHKVDGKTCFRCGGMNHDPNSCAFRNKDCFYCKKTGHTARMCKKKKGGLKDSGKDLGKDSSVKQLEEVVVEEKSGEGTSSVQEQGEQQGEIYRIYRCEVQKEDPIFVRPCVNGKKQDFELDTGAACSCMGNKTFRRELPGVKLHETNIRLKTFSGEIMKHVGIAEVEVVENGVRKKLPLVITPGDTPTLLGGIG